MSQDALISVRDKLGQDADITVPGFDILDGER